MVNQADDWPDIKFSQAMKACVGPLPIDAVEAGRSDAFPKYRIPNSSYAQLRNPIDVFAANRVGATFNLIEVTVAYAVDRALNSRPYFKRPNPFVPGSHQSS
jgi:hypothetical protein